MLQKLKKLFLKLTTFFERTELSLLSIATFKILNLIVYKLNLRETWRIDTVTLFIQIKEQCATKIPFSYLCCPNVNYS